MIQLTRRAVIAAAMAVITVVPAAGAQSFSRAKDAATRAVSATNAHTTAETADQSPQTLPSRQRASSAVVTSSGSMKSSAGEPKAGAAAAGTARGSKSDISLVRESFAYSADGRRDPFMSLMKTGELRPAVSDLKLVTVVYDPAGRSVAILRDLTTKEQYRIKVGQTLGRMRVASIQPKSVTFTVIAIGTTFQEVLALNDTTRARTQ
jgi:hypothetical protein